LRSAWCLFWVSSLWPLPKRKLFLVFLASHEFWDGPLTRDLLTSTTVMVIEIPAEHDHNFSLIIMCSFHHCNRALDNAIYCIFPEHRALLCNSHNNIHIPNIAAHALCRCFDLVNNRCHHWYMYCWYPIYTCIPLKNREKTTFI
jgi:hypothetical protein